MSASNLFLYFGIPTLFLLLCVISVGWVSSKQNKKFVQKPVRWATVWGLFGCFIAVSL